jgi:hypothetical protein
MKKIRIIIVVLNILISCGLLAANATWTGASGGDFNTGGNWSTGAVPGAGDNVIITEGDMVINMSASRTINDFTITCSGGGSRLLVFNTNGNILTVNGTTSTGSGASDEIELHANAAPGGFVFNGDVNFDNGFGAGTTQIKADITSEGSMTFNANLTTGTNVFTEPGIEPKFYFDKAGTQSWTFNSTVYYIVPQSLIVGVTNTPTLNLVGTGSTFRIGVYDGSLTVNSNCIMDIGTFDVDNFIGGAMTLLPNSLFRTGGTNSLPAGYSGGYNYDATSTVEYYGSNQSVGAVTYGNILFTGTGTKTSLASFIIAGNFTSNTAWNDGNDTHTFTSAITQTITGSVAPTFYNLTVNNSSANGIDMLVDVTVDRQLTLTNGRVNTVANILAVTNPNTGRISGHNATNYINTGANGVLRRYVNSTGSYDLPVGNSDGYQLANINLTAGGTVTYLDVNFDNLATGISGIPFTEGIYIFSDILNNGGAGVGTGNANNGVWTISPNAGTATYNVSLYGRNHDNEGSQRHTVVKRSQSGGSTLEISENFDGCLGSAPAGWSTNVASGSDDWVFNSTTFAGNTIDGTCMASFDDDAGGAYDNTVELYSPVVDMSSYATGSLAYDYFHEDYIGSGSLTVEVYDGSVWQQVFFETNDASGSRTEDITAHMNVSFQVRWIYDDDDDWAWGAAIDNVSLTGAAAAGPYGNWAPVGTYSSSTTVTPVTAIRTGLSGFSQFALGVSDAALPIKLTSFTGKCGGAEVELEWTTETEINNDFFTIERSADAINFEEVDFIQGAGNSSVSKSYSYKDNSPYSLVYYKLKQTDFNGDFSYSEVISVASCLNNNFDFVPYQRNSDVVLSVNSGSEGEYIIDIIDLRGKNILRESVKVVEGSNSFRLNPVLSSGSYLVRLTSYDLGKTYNQKMRYIKR